MAIPTCAQDCNANLPAVDFDDCAPVVSFSEIRRIFIAKSNAAAFANWAAAAEWEARLSQSSTTGNDYIRALTVIGDKPAATEIVKDISNGRQVTIGKDHVINFTIDDVSQANYEFMRWTECGGKFIIWYETEGGWMYGGNAGIPKVKVSVNSVLPRGRDEIETLVGTLTFRQKFHPERVASPIFDGDTENTVPTTFDSDLVFSGATSQTEDGVTGTVSATDPEQKFEFNAITPQIGTPQSMTISVDGVEEIVIDYTTDYSGQYFKYTDKAGAEHTGQFYNGDIDF